MGQCSKIHISVKTKQNILSLAIGIYDVNIVIHKQFQNNRVNHFGVIGDSISPKSPYPLILITDFDKFWIIPTIKNK